MMYLDDIFIYIKEPNQPYVNAIQLVLKQLRKHSLYVNLKKYQFQKDEVEFLSFVVSA